MATDEARKKWGSIFMGEREVSAEQLDAMQEPARRERMRKEQTEDYMERVRKRAADRAREILGAAYAERLKVLDEARAEAEAARRAAARDGQKLKGESEALKREAAEELEKARAIREEAEKIRAAAREDGLREGMAQADGELREFRGELGRSLARVLGALGGERKKLLETWREELCDLVREAAAAGAGYILQKEHKEALAALVMQALRQLENRATISVRVNPEDEAAVADMFQAARECVPDIRQWIVTPDENIEPGGFIAESGAGRVDCRRENFRNMVADILAHLTLPVQESEEESGAALRDMIDEEAARLAQFAPEAAEIAAAEALFPEDEAREQAEGAGEAPESGRDAEAGDDIGEMAPDAGAGSDAAEAAAAPIQPENPAPAIDIDDNPGAGAFDPQSGEAAAAAQPAQEAGEAGDPRDLPDQGDAAFAGAAAEALAGYAPPDSPDSPDEDDWPGDGEQDDIFRAEDASPPAVDPADSAAPEHEAFAEDQPGQSGAAGAASSPADAKAGAAGGEPTLAELEDELFPPDVEG